jgi:hypothetical protein
MEDEEYLHDEEYMEANAIEDTVDYKQLLEEANQRTEKVSQDYKDMHANWQRLSASLEKNNKVLLENGLIDDIDNRGHIIINKKSTQENNANNPFEAIKEEKKRLRRQYTNGDIDETEWNNKLEDLTDKERDLLIKETERKTLERVAQIQEEQSREKAVKNSELDRQNRLLEVAKKYPESEMTNSKLFKEMDRLYAENKRDYIDGSLDPQTSAVIREKLIRDAYESLGETRPTINNRFASVKSSPYKQEDPDIQEVDKLMLTLDIDPAYRKSKQLMASLRETLVNHKKTNTFKF